MRYTSADGLLSSSDPEAVRLWESICREHETQQASWSDVLKAMGIKLEHPDDGWVHGRGTDAEYLTLSWYPRFNLNPQPGDLIAIGRPPSGDHFTYGDETRTWARNGYRICRVTEVRHGGVLIPSTYFDYVDTGQRVPAEKPARLSLIRRALAKVTR